MKKTLLFLIIGTLLVSSTLFAADGDFIIEGNVGIGTSSPRWGCELRGFKFLTFSMPGFDHGMPDYKGTDILGHAGGEHPISGGFLFAGISNEGIPAITIEGTIGQEILSEYAPPILFRGFKRDGTFRQTIEDNETLVGFKNGYDSMVVRVMGDGTIRSEKDNTGISFGTDQDARIYWDGTNLVMDTSATGNLYVTGQVSATYFDTRTPKLDSYNADFLTRLTTPQRMLNYEGKLDRAELLDGEAVMITVKDKDNCTEVYDSTNYCWVDERTKRQYCVQDANAVPEGFEYTEAVRTREECGTKQEDGMRVDALGMNNRLLISELKEKNKLLTQEINLIKEEMCSSLGKFCSGK